MPELQGDVMKVDVPWEMQMDASTNNTRASPRSTTFLIRPLHLSALFPLFFSLFGRSLMAFSGVSRRLPFMEGITIRTAYR